MGQRRRIAIGRNDLKYIPTTLPNQCCYLISVTFFVSHIDRPGAKGEGIFNWTAGVMGLCCALVKAKLADLLGSDQDWIPLAGIRRDVSSYTISLDYAVTGSVLPQLVQNKLGYKRYVSKAPVNHGRWCGQVISCPSFMAGGHEFGEGFGIRVRAYDAVAVRRLGLKSSGVVLSVYEVGPSFLERFLDQSSVWRNIVLLRRHRRL